MKITHKDQHEVKSDNTRVTRPLFIERIEYYKNKMGIRIIFNRVINWFLNEDKDEEYIIWCNKHGYIEDL